MNAQPVPHLDARIMAYAAERGITEVLHFTTDRGLLGIFASGAVLSRDRLETNMYIEHILIRNCANRLKDAGWTDYVNLSISRVNGRMLGISENWHTNNGVWWTVLAFDVALLAHPGVYFTTTNNTYSSCVRRGTGAEGLAALFSASVEWGHHGSVQYRSPTAPSSWTTDHQAEVLYPTQLPTDRLQRIYVRDPDNIDYVKSLFPLFSSVPKVPVEHKPEVFQ
ncbi:MAG: DarT ssDNA thymidine ADP-ribosyltransferase family protein [Pseudonocardiaceae bacterium]